MGWLSSPRGGVCCDCQPVVCDPCDPTPCDLGTLDNTDLGTVSINPCSGPDRTNFQSGASLEVGIYEFLRLHGAFHDDCNPCPWTTTSLWKSYQSYFIQGGSVVARLDDVSFCAATIAAVEAENPGPFSFETAGVLGIRIDQGCVLNCVVGNNVQWHLQRTRKRAVTQPEKLRIKNFTTYALGRWAITYLGLTTALLAFTASAGDVQTALNALANITAEGGVTVTGSLAAGWTIAWNTAGFRVPFTSTVTTVNVGWKFTITTTLLGSPVVAENQKILLTFSCATCLDETVLTEWDGTLADRTFTDSSINDVRYFSMAPALHGSNRVSEKLLYFARCRYAQSLVSLTPNGCGWILEIYCQDGSGNPITMWQGVKGNKTTGDGVYAYTDSTDTGNTAPCVAGTGPASLELEVY